jgi:Ca2+-binding RTX toxin-like protein
MRIAGTLVAIAVVALAMPGATLSGTTSAPKDKCAKLKPVKSPKFELCSHGGDPVGKLKKSTPAIQGPQSPTSLATVAPCPDGGTGGKRIEVIYGVPQDRTNQYATTVQTIRDTVAQADAFLDASTPGVTGQHYRWLCDNGTDVTVRNVTLVPVGTDNSFTFSDMLQSLQNQTGLGLGNVNYNQPDRIYLTFVDQITNVYPYGGQATIANDDTPDPATNLNNDSSPDYSLIAYYDPGIVEHEIGHNIGAVQLSAPHSSGGWHCYEEQDEMCYYDGGSYFANGGQLVFNCPNDSDWLFDCGHDDYYSANPSAGSYLDAHWNVTNSGFLTPISNSTPQCTITGTSAAETITGTSGDDYICALAGNDIIKGLGGNDIIDGGDGMDQANFGVPVMVDLGQGTATGEGSDTLKNIENAGGSSAVDVLTGSSAVNVLKGNGGADRIIGLDGNDKLYGNKGNDYLAGGGGNDVVSGGPGTDTCVKGPGIDSRTSCEKLVAP